MKKQGKLFPKDIRLLNAIIKKYDAKKEFLICILQDIQNRYEYLPEDLSIFSVEEYPTPGRPCSVMDCPITTTEDNISKLKSNVFTIVN